MGAVQLEHAFCLDVLALGHAGDALEVFLHLERDLALGREEHGLALELVAQAHGLHEAGQALLNEIEKLTGLLLLLLRLLLLVLGLEAEVVGGDVAEGLFLIGAQNLHHELVDAVGQAEHIVPGGADGLGLRQGGCAFDGLGAGVVDLLLSLGHGRDVFGEGDELVVVRAVEHQQILKLILVHAVIADDAVFELRRERLVERRIFLAILVAQAGKLALDLLLKVAGDDLELAVVLQKLTGDVQAQVGRVDDAAYKPEIFRHEVGAFLHDHDAGGIELQTGLVVAGVVVVRGLGRDEQHGPVARQTLRVHTDDADGVGHVVEVLLVVFPAVVVGRLALRALPDGDHRVDDLILDDRVVGALAVLAAVFVPLAALDHHVDGPADVVGILADEIPELPALEVRGIVLLLGVGLYVHDDVGADGILLTRLDRIAVRARRMPAVRLVRAVRPRDHRHLVRDHERRVEAHAELADHVDGGAARLALALGLAEHIAEPARAARGDDAEVGLQLLLCHADAVVGHGQRPGVPVHVDADEEILSCHADGLVRQGAIAELVDRVRGVRDDLTQEDLLMGVDGVDHEVQKTLRLRFELFLCHVIIRPFVPCRLALKFHEC